MKPAPSAHLLGPGQAWAVVVAPQWGPVSGRECNVKWRDGDQEPCRAPAVIADVLSPFSNYEVLCERHMGYHRWIDNGVVYQWRAQPVWRYGPRRPKLPPRKREQ